MDSNDAQAGRAKCTAMVVTAMILARGIARQCRVGMADRAAHEGDEGGGISAGGVSRFGGQGQHRNHNAHEHGERRQQDRHGPADASHVMLPEIYHSRFRWLRSNSYALRTSRAIDCW